MSLTMRVDHVCVSFNLVYVLGYVSAALILRSILRDYAKRSVAVSYIVSMLTTYYFIATQDQQVMISYYWYDLAASIIFKDKLMIFHHLFTMYGMFHCDDHPDYNNIWTLLVVFKTSDILLHHYSISHCLELDKKYMYIRYYQIITTFYTIVMHIICRFCLVLYMFPFKTMKVNVLMSFFITLNVFWALKLTSLLKRLIIKSDLHKVPAELNS